MRRIVVKSENHISQYYIKDQLGIYMNKLVY